MRPQAARGRPRMLAIACRHRRETYVDAEVDSAIVYPVRIGNDPVSVMHTSPRAIYQHTQNG